MASAKRLIAGTLLAGCLLTGCATGESSPHPVVEHRVHWLANDHVRVGVAPAIGRVVWFGATGADNLLWMSDAPPSPADVYVNWGGDKLWPAPQAVWAEAFGQRADWPPDGVIDGESWRVVEATDDRLVIESHVNRDLQVRARRAIELLPDHPAVRMVNTLTRVAPNRFPVHVWTVTQVRPPSFILMGTAPDATPWVSLLSDPEQKAHVMRINDQAICFRPPAGKLKIGTRGGWVASVWDDVVLVEHTAVDPAGVYADGTSAQVYTSPDYAELELLSPTTQLQPGETLSNTVTWRLLPRRNRTPAELAAALARRIR